MWFQQQLDPGSPVFNLPMAVEMAGNLDAKALHQALNGIVARHEALRTTFSSIHGVPEQVIHEAQGIELPLVDLRPLSPVERESEFSRLTEMKACRPFDLEKEFPFRASLVQTGNENHTLLLNIHHIASDGWSWGVFFREFVSLYERISRGESPQLEELPIQYADYGQWQRERMRGEALEKQLSYWKKQLGGDLPVLQLPADHIRPAVQTYRGAQESFRLPAELTAKLKELSRREGVTLYMTLLAAFETLLYRYSGQEEIIVGSPIANRTLAETEGLIGFFMNTLAMRSDLRGEPTFLELLKQVRQVSLDAYANQDVPFGKLVEVLQPERDPSRSPIFQAMLILQNSPAAKCGLSGLDVSWRGIHSKTSQFDLYVSIRESAAELAGYWDYSTDLFETATARRLLGSYRTLLEGVVQKPEERISRLPILREAERHQLVVKWNDTAVAYPRNLCLHELIEGQVERTPEAAAVVYEDRQISYSELNRRANQLAHYLRKLGVGPEVLVGVCMERSIEMVVGLLGILKAGGAYVPLDPMYPEDRVAYMVEDSRLKVLVTEQRFRGRFAQKGTPLVCLDSDWQAISRESSENCRTEVGPENLAYVIYTSGSTGKPKGVQIPHRALVNFLISMRAAPGMTEKDILLAVTTISFDIAGLELYLPLITGARVVLASREVAVDGEGLRQLLEESKATVMQATPATWQMLLESGWKGGKHLKVLCGGEAWSRDLATQLINRCGSVWNMYGPTETTVWSTVHQVTSAEGPIMIGRPIANTEIYILDRHLQPAPVGVTGELYIGGDGVARGYLNRPELSAEKFIPNPFSEMPGSRIYNTGDLARYLPDGTIDCLGRTDHQVKIRGYRIEPGEMRPC